MQLLDVCGANHKRGGTWCADIKVAYYELCVAWGKVKGCTLPCCYNKLKQGKNKLFDKKTYSKQENNLNLQLRSQAFS